MRISSLAALAVVVILPSCYQLEATALVGYTHMSVDGELGYVDGSSGGGIQQDVESAFGLGDEQGTPYGRAMLDLGVPVLSVSGYRFEESGSGVLEANVGSNPILIPGTPVNTEFELSNIKASVAFEIGLGPISVQPGIAVDWFDMHVQVRDTIGIASETLDLSGPVPLLFVRGEVDVGIVDGMIEVGYVEADVDEVDGSLLDIELLVQVRPVGMLTLFAGYQLLLLDANGEVDGDAYDADLQIGGFLIGGGLTW